MRRLNLITLRGPTALLLGGLLFIGGCGDDPSAVEETGQEEEVNDLPEVNSYLQALPDWSSFAEVEDTVDTPAGDAIADLETGRLCTETPYSITQNPEAIVTFGRAPNVLYLGSLIQGDSYLGGLLSMEELPIRQRAPLVIAIDVFSGTTVTDTVANPDGSSVHAALNDLISEAASTTHELSADVYYNEAETHSLKQATLRLGLSVRGMGSEVEGQLSYSATREKHTITAFYKHVMFDAFIVTPQTPAEFFTREFTQARLDEQVQLGNIGPGNLPVYVGRIQYGRMMMYTMTSNASVADMKSAVEGSYNGFTDLTASVEAEYRQILEESEYTYVTIGGGDNSEVLAQLKDGGIRSYFEQEDAITTAAPLAYTLYNLADGSIAKVSETTEYTMTECSAANAVCYTNRSEWEAAMEALAPSHSPVIDLPTTADTLVMANEVLEPPGENGQLGSVLTFDSTTTGYPFTFLLRAPVPGHQFVFDDKEGSSYSHAFGGMDQERSLGVGDVNDYDNDDFEIQFPGYRANTGVFAFGITVANNIPESGEFTSVSGTGGYTKELTGCVPSSHGTHGFLGILSTVPLHRVFFNEHSAGNDIFVRDPVFGILEW